MNWGSFALAVAVSLICTGIVMLFVASIRERWVYTDRQVGVYLFLLIISVGLAAGFNN